MTAIPSDLWRRYSAGTDSTVMLYMTSFTTRHGILKERQLALGNSKQWMSQCLVWQNGPNRYLTVQLK